MCVYIYMYAELYFSGRLIEKKKKKKVGGLSVAEGTIDTPNFRNSQVSFPRNSSDPHYLVPHCYLGHIPSLFGSRWVVGYQVVGVLRVPRIFAESHTSHAEVLAALGP